MCVAPQRRALATSQLLKVVRSWCALYILAWTCASRHNGVHFFDISTSKSGPTLVCFVRFDSEVCFAPQRRALFRHLNLQKRSGPLRCFVHPDLDMYFAPQQRAIFFSHLPRWLCTRRFSEPTFRPSGASNHWKNTVFRDFPSFSRTCISLFRLSPGLSFSISDLLTSDLLHV